MELALVIAIVAAGFAGWTAWESRRSAGAALASAKAAESSAAASQVAVQLESKRFEWEQSARLALTERSAYQGHLNTVLAAQLNNVVNAAVNDWPEYIAFEFRNVGQAPATDIDVQAHYLGDVFRPQDSVKATVASGETVHFVFNVKTFPTGRADMMKFLLLVKYHDIRPHELALQMAVYSKTGGPDNPYLAHNKDGAFYKPSVVLAELDGARHEEMETGDVVWVDASLKIAREERRRMRRGDFESGAKQPSTM